MSKIIYENSNPISDISFLLESSIGHADEAKQFRVDISDERRAHHGRRLKIPGRINPKGYGTSVPILDIKDYDMDYDDLINHTGTKTVPESEKFLPLITGFVTMHHDELIEYSKSVESGSSYDKKKSELKGLWKSYTSKYSYKDKAKIRRDANAFIHNKKK